MRYLAIPALLLCFCAAQAAEVPDAEPDESTIKAQCKDEWDTDYRMIKHCVERQQEAAAEVLALWDEHDEGAEERAIIERCLDEWLDDEDRPDWRMTNHCAERQIEAYEEVQ